MTEDELELTRMADDGAPPCDELVTDDGTVLARVPIRPANPNHPPQTDADKWVEELGFSALLGAWAEYAGCVWDWIVTCPKYDDAAGVESDGAWLTPIAMTMLMMHAEQSLQLAGMLYMADIGPLSAIATFALQGESPLESAEICLGALEERGGDMTAGWVAERRYLLANLQDMEANYQAP